MYRTLIRFFFFHFKIGKKKKNQTCQMCVEEEDKEKMLILFADANY